MLSEKMSQELNKQLNRELYSGYLYLGMSAYFSSQGLPGFANWMRVQAQEELTHAMRFYDYLTKKGARVELEDIQAPRQDWQGVQQVLEATLQHEKKVTAFINDLVDLAIQEKDHATNNFLQWFVSEQVEEEESATTILDRLRLLGQERSSLFLLDQELGKRVFTPPAPSKD